MSKQEKEAILCLLIFSLFLITFIVLIQFHSTLISFSLATPIFALYGILPYLILKNKNEVTVDERDNVIGQKAGKIGFGSFWIIFVLVVTFILTQKGANSMIPASYLAYLLFGGMILIYTVRAIAILILYRIGVNYE